MGQIQELEQRITAAFQRISAGVEALSATPAPISVEAEAPEPAATAVDIPAATVVDDGVASDEATSDRQLWKRRWMKNGWPMPS